MSQPDRLSQTFAGRQVILFHGSEKKVIGSEVLWSPPRRHFNFCLKHLWLNSRDNGERYFVLESENVRQITLEPVRPNVRARHRINQLPCDANFPRCLAHGPLKDITHAKPPPDFLDIDGFALEGEPRVASDYEQRFEPRERRNDLLNHSVREVFLFGVATHVLERQNRNRGLVGEREGWLQRGCRRALFPDRTDESEAFTWQCLDEALLLAGIAKGSPCGIQARCKRSIGNDTAVPNGVDE